MLSAMRLRRTSPLSHKTRPTFKTPKDAPKAPGTPSGPMGLPLSYNVKEYKLKPDLAASGKMRVSKAVRRRGASGAARYKKNKLLNQDPIS